MRVYISTYLNYKIYRVSQRCPFWLDFFNFIFEFIKKDSISQFSLTIGLRMQYVKETMINMKPLTLLSYLMVVNLCSIIYNQDLGSQNEKNTNTLLVVISIKASTLTYLVK